MNDRYEIPMTIVLNILKNYRYQGKYMNLKKFLLDLLGTNIESGIYAIRNTNNNKLYIGSSIELSKRIRSHINMLKNGTHHSPHLQYAWDNDGSKAFSLLILELVEDESKLIEREQYWLDFYKSYDDNCGYNISPTAGNTLGVKIRDESKRKMSQVRKGRRFTEEHRRKISIALKGKKKKPEAIEKMRMALTGRKLSEEHKQKIRASCKGINTGKRSAEFCAKVSAACKGRKGYNRKLTDENVREIRLLLAKGVPQYVIAKKFGVAKSNIYSIYHNKTYKDVI